MLSLKLTTLAVLATLSVAAPAPVSSVTSISTTTSEEIKPFSFSQWVEDIINPDVVALTPEQALEAYYESINSTTTSSSRNLAKRADATCETNNSGRMPVADAVWLVNTMAAGGQTIISIPISVYTMPILKTDNGRSRMLGTKTIPANLKAASESYARAGGFIMDACTWGDMSGGQILMPANPFITVVMYGVGY